ncbi:hypothetical protein [Paraburkholderia lycopersici]|nr:hypothetical protein [Paraburkholderia lycopersici]
MATPIMDATFKGFVKVVRHVASRKRLDHEKDAARRHARKDRQTAP